MNADLRDRLLAIFSEADAAVAAAGPKCEASGRCCRFQEWGHVLFLSSLEAEYLLENAPSYDRPASADTCPFQVHNLCTAREPRPLGCRVYFCDPGYQETGNAITEAALTKLKSLCAEYGIEWRYAPLHHFLSQMPKFENHGNSRIALPVAAAVS